MPKLQNININEDKLNDPSSIYYYSPPQNQNNTGSLGNTKQLIKKQNIIDSDEIKQEYIPTESPTTSNKQQTQTNETDQNKQPQSNITSNFLLKILSHKNTLILASSLLVLALVTLFIASQGIAVLPCLVIGYSAAAIGAGLGATSFWAEEKLQTNNEEDFIKPQLRI